jgi:hypothetical protein
VVLRPPRCREALLTPVPLSYDRVMSDALDLRTPRASPHARHPTDAPKWTRPCDWRTLAGPEKPHRQPQMPGSSPLHDTSTQAVGANPGAKGPSSRCGPEKAKARNMVHCNTIRRSRLGDLNPGPTHYERAATAPDFSEILTYQ